MTMKTRRPKTYGMQCELEEAKQAVVCWMDQGERPRKRAVQREVTVEGKPRRRGTEETSILPLKSQKQIFSLHFEWKEKQVFGESWQQVPGVHTGSDIVNHFWLLSFHFLTENNIVGNTFGPPDLFLWPCTSSRAGQAHRPRLSAVRWIREPWPACSLPPRAFLWMETQDTHTGGNGTEEPLPRLPPSRLLL